MEFEKILIVLTSSPTDGIKHYSALRFAERARQAGKEAMLVCVADGVHCMKKRAASESASQSDIAARVEQIIEQGVKVAVCRAPAQLLGISPADLIEGVEIIDDVFSMLVKKDVRVIWL